MARRLADLRGQRPAGGYVVGAVIAYLCAAVLGITIQLPDGQQITGASAVYDLDTATVFVVEGPLFADGFE